MAGPTGIRAAVIPAQAGIQKGAQRLPPRKPSIPASAGMTGTPTYNPGWRAVSSVVRAGDS